MRRSRTLSSSSSSATLRLRLFTAQPRRGSRAITRQRRCEAVQNRRSGREMRLSVWGNLDSLPTASALARARRWRVSLVLAFTLPQPAQIVGVFAVTQPAQMLGVLLARMIALVGQPFRFVDRAPLRLPPLPDLAVV